MRLFFLFLGITCFPAFSQTDVEFNLITTEDQTTIDVFRCYITNVHVSLANGKSIKEDHSYHLIDLEYPKSLKFNLDIPKRSEITAIHFTVGTDQQTNESGALDGALDPINGMYWAWNTGYINFKLEGKRKGQDFEFHIGGYLAPFPTAREVSLELNKPTKRIITIDIDIIQFLKNLDLGASSSILIPGETASNIADQYQRIFHINE